MKLVRTAGIAVAAGALTLGMAPAANAASPAAPADTGEVTAAPAPAYSFTWRPGGDRLTVCDKRADGWGVKGHVRYPARRNGRLMISVTDPSQRPPCNSRANARIPENRWVLVHTWSYRGNRTTNHVWLKCHTTRARCVRA